MEEGSLNLRVGGTPAADGTASELPASSVGLHAGPATKNPQRASCAEPPSQREEMPSAGSSETAKRSMRQGYVESARVEHSGR